tara:strand:- start:2282 stop:3175 length:894 start_codon:yes stop_codon:yes gene_type:complete
MAVELHGRSAVEVHVHPDGEPLHGMLRDEDAALGRFTLLPPRGTTCFFSAYEEHLDWNYHRFHSQTSERECAAACLRANGCTGFEFPVNADYCALWYHGSCDDLESPGITKAANSRGAQVITYVLCGAPFVNCSWVPPSPPPLPPIPPQLPSPPGRPPLPPLPPAQPPIPPMPPTPPEPPWLAPAPAAWLTLTDVGLGLSFLTAGCVLAMYAMYRLRDSFLFDLYLLGYDWVADLLQTAWLMTARGADHLLLRWLDWRSRWRAYLSGNPGSPAASPEEVELQSVQLTNADAAAVDSE